tara:strand:+ start:101 stop:613 length:513 start_codon:yes stop_codon:yes gene_type:complete
MLRANFFFNFFKYKQNSSNEIVQYNSNQSLSLQDQIKTKIIEIDQNILETSKALVEAQIVKLRSTFSKSNNFIEKFGKNVYKAKLDDSINWHQKQLKDLYLRRRELEINLEKLKGVFWLNRFKRLLRTILIGFLIILSLLIFFSGFMIMIYLMPLIILIFLVYFIYKKKY